MSQPIFLRYSKIVWAIFSASLRFLSVIHGRGENVVNHDQPSVGTPQMNKPGTS